MTQSTKKKDPALRLIKALAHPLRHQILQALNLRTASPSDLAAELGEPLGNVSYHVKVLAENGAIEQVKTAPVRGALEHFYRATMRPWFDDEMWAELAIPTRRAIFREILKDMWSDLIAAAEDDQLDHPTTHITRTWLELDEEAYEKLVARLNTVVEEALDLHAESAPRLAEMPEDERSEHRTALMIMHFHRASTNGAAARSGE